MRRFIVSVCCVIPGFLGFLGHDTHVVLLSWYTCYTRYTVQESEVSETMASSVISVARCKMRRDGGCYQVPQSATLPVPVKEKLISVEDPCLARQSGPSSDVQGFAMAHTVPYAEHRPPWSIIQDPWSYFIVLCTGAWRYIYTCTVCCMLDVLDTEYLSTTLHMSLCVMYVVN